MQLSVNVVDFIMLALAVQGFILAGLLFYSSKSYISNRWLALLVFIVSEAAVIMELTYSSTWDRHPILELIIPHFILATGPVIYFYTLSVLFPSTKLTWKHCLNFVPLIFEFKYQLIFLLYITGLLSVIKNFYFMPFVQQLLFGRFPFCTYFGWISLIVYSIITYLTIVRYEKSNTLSKASKNIAWVKSIIYCTFLLAVIWLFSIVVNSGFSKSVLALWDHYILYLPLLVFIYLLAMAAWRRENNNQKTGRQYFNEADKHIKELLLLMESERIYLNPLLKVDDVASSISISEKALSNLLNQHMGKGFNDFINEYRINAVKTMLTDPRYNNFTIAAIAFDCGFNSVATFQRVFKQFTGTTPSKFQNTEDRAQIVTK